MKLDLPRTLSACLLSHLLCVVSQVFHTMHKQAHRGNDSQTHVVLYHCRFCKAVVEHDPYANENRINSVRLKTLNLNFF